MKLKIDRNGWEYYEKLPAGWRLATIDDFHDRGKKKLGMEFLIRWVTQEYYQLCRVGPDLTGSTLKPFIDEQRVYVKKNEISG